MLDRISRREFIAKAGTLFAATVIPFEGWPLSAAADSRLTVLTNRYPKVFAFRQAEALANIRNYHDWEAAFRPLSGVVAKLLPEERTDTVTMRNAIFFTRFKQRYPSKLALLHMNGRARLPMFETEGWFAGWWLYRAGTRTVEALGKDTTTLRVTETTPFRLEIDCFGRCWEDLVITKCDVNGLPDFSVAEHIRLIAIDGGAGSLMVERAMYGSAARAWPVGSYIAPHVTNGPYFRGDKVWLYNFSTSSPRDSAGLHVIDGIMAGLRPRFAPGGQLAALDGIELDIFNLATGGREGVDADGDGVSDSAMAGEEDLYTLGLVDFARQLRAMLGPDRLLLVDGGLGQRPDMAAINGIEHEGFPSLSDVDQLKWSQGLADMAFFEDAGLSPRLSYAMYKFSPPLEPPERFSRFRLALAASLITNSAFTFYDEPTEGSTKGLPPGPDSGIFPNIFTIWDEIRGGDLNRACWLGRPMGEAVHAAESLPDLYNGAGVALTNTFIGSITNSGTTIKKIKGTGGRYLLLQSGSGDIDVNLPTVLSGPDLVLLIDISADPLKEFPATLPRFMTVTASTAGSPVISRRLTVPVNRRWRHLILAFRRLSPGEVSLNIKAEGAESFRLRGIKTAAGSDIAYREFESGAVFVNPSDFPATFDLSTLLPGRSFRRLTGSPDQDPETNNGSLIVEELIVPPLDALLVVKAV